MEYGKYEAPHFTPVFMGQPRKTIDVDRFLKEGTIVETNAGKILRFRFENSYGASVITTAGSYGEIDQWELGVLYYTTGLTDEDGKRSLVYDTPITGDVIGYLNWNQVESILSDIQKLAPRQLPNNVLPIK